MAPASSTSLKRSLTKVCESLEERYGQRRFPDFEDFIECLVFQILELGASERAAKDGLKRIKEEYVDWNDMRVATVREIQDILGPRYVRCREKAEDLHSLLADLYTAFRRMDLTEMVRTSESIETLRALPDTTLIRVDMVETALLAVCHVRTFPCDEDQFLLLQYLKGVPGDATLEDIGPAVVEALDNQELHRLARGLREHIDFCHQKDEYEPQPVTFGWDKPKPKRTTTRTHKAAEAATGDQAATAEKVATKKAATKKTATKKTATKKTATKKAATKKAATKKTATKKTATKKTEDQEPASQEPTSQEPASQEPASQEPASQEPASQESTTRNSGGDA